MAEISDSGMPGLSTGTFARVTGRVQGVSYRASAKAEADEFGLIGWVRNTADGAVELLTGGEGAGGGRGCALVPQRTPCSGGGGC